MLNATRIEDDGRMRGISVVGFHGSFDAELTPAIRGAVHVDAEGCLVRLVDAQGRFLAGPGAPAGGIHAERLSSVPIGEGALPGDGTRMTSRAARVDGLFLAVGRRERAEARRLVEVPGGYGEAARVRGFFEAMVAGDAALQAVGADVRGELVLWYCSAEEAAGVKRRCAKVATEVLVDACRGGVVSQVQAASYWLGRAATMPDDILRAAAGLERAMAASHRVETMLSRLRESSPEQRRAGLQEARGWLERMAALRREVVTTRPLAAEGSLAKGRDAVRAVRTAPAIRGTVPREAA